MKMLRVEESNEQRRDPHDDGFINILFSWSLQNIFDDKLYKQKV